MNLHERLRLFANRSEQSAAERFESDSEDFYRETGYIAPGRSVPLAMDGVDFDERRRVKWAEWCAEKQRVYTAALREAADAIESATVAP